MTSQALNTIKDELDASRQAYQKQINALPGHKEGTVRILGGYIAAIDKALGELEAESGRFAVVEIRAGEPLDVMLRGTEEDAFDLAVSMAVEDGNGRETVVVENLRNTGGHWDGDWGVFVVRVKEP